MDAIRVIGGTPLVGDVYISGAKNAALPLLTLTLLTDEPIVFCNVPQLSDITTMVNLLQNHGTQVHVDGSGTYAHPHKRVLRLTTQDITSDTAPYEIVRKMRASIVVLGPLLARHGYAKVSLPGGCAIGTRPVDLHLKAMEALGADIQLEEGYVIATAPKGGLQGGVIEFPIVSVGATENALMAAVLAKGTTQINNAAREPEITDLAECLIKMGAKIEGLGTSQLVVTGVESLQGAVHDVLPDRIETGTYMVGAAMTRGQITLHDTRADLLESTIDVMREMGAEIEVNGTTITCGAKERLRAASASTAPHPLFPTDMQAQIMAAMTLAKGRSTMAETIFENRFMHVPELVRMGAQISIDGHTAIIEGVEQLNGAEVMATDLRASVSLVLAALTVEGESRINRVYHIDRGYERIEEKFRRLGADVTRVA